MPAVVLPAQRRLRLVAAGQTEEASFTAEGISAGPLRLAYDDVLLAAAMWVVEYVREDDPDAFEFDGGGHRHLKQKFVDDVTPQVSVRRHSPRVEIVARDGRRFRFDPPGERIELLREVLQAVSWRSRRAHLEWGARALIAGREPLWARFDTVEDADQYVQWQAQLAQLKSLSNYGRNA